MVDDFSNEIKQLLRHVTPERKEELESLLEGVTFDANVDGYGFDYSVLPTWRLVRIPIRCQFRLWAHCFAYYTAFDAFAKQKNGITLNRQAIPDDAISSAEKLLEWAVKADVSVWRAKRQGNEFFVSEIPEEFPVQFEDESMSVLKKASDEIFVYAMASSIHHELAHMRLGHREEKDEQSIQEEYDADEAAASWILGSPMVSEYDYLIRHLGIAIKFIWYTSIFFSEKHQSTTHPPSWRRLFKSLEPTVRRELDPIWGFIIIALTLHFQRFGIALHCLSSFEPSKSTVKEMIEIIEKHNNQIGQA